LRWVEVVEGDAAAALVAWAAPRLPGRAATASAPVAGRVPHVAGQPCYQKKCPRCGAQMTR
jgi:hypothetical protein